MHLVNYDCKVPGITIFLNRKNDILLFPISREAKVFSFVSNLFKSLSSVIIWDYPKKDTGLLDRITISVFKSNQKFHFRLLSCHVITLYSWHKKSFQVRILLSYFKRNVCFISMSLYPELNKVPILVLFYSFQFLK